MALSCQNSASYGVLIEPGVYIDQATIRDVSELTDSQPENFKRPIGLGIGLILEKEGLSFNPEIKIFGDPKLDDAGNVVDWGSAFPVRNVLSKIGRYAGTIGVTGNPKKIPDEALLGLIGKTVVFLRYCYAKGTDGKVRYSTWKQVSSSTEDLVKQWRSARVKGYPRDYDRSLVEKVAEPIGDSF